MHANRVTSFQSRDLKINMKDTESATLSFGSRTNGQNWNPFADVTETERFVPDGIVDIRDLVAKSPRLRKNSLLSVPKT